MVHDAFVVRVLNRIGLEAALKGAHRISFFTGDCDDSAASWHLEDVVAMVRDRHELGQGSIPEDGIVRQMDVSDVEVDELGVVVVAFPKVTGRRTCPIGTVEPSVTPEKGLVG